MNCNYELTVLTAAEAELTYAETCDVLACLRYLRDMTDVTWFVPPGQITKIQKFLQSNRTAPRTR